MALAMLSMTINKGSPLAEMFPALFRIPSGVHRRTSPSLTSSFHSWQRLSRLNISYTYPNKFTITSDQDDISVPEGQFSTTWHPVVAEHAM
jgi:hypothetical protein